MGLDTSLKSPIALICSKMVRGKSSNVYNRSAGHKFSAIYGTQTCNTVFTRMCHWTLPWARWIRSTI